VVAVVEERLVETHQVVQVVEDLVILETVQQYQEVQGP
jgi:hypothetical protein